MTLIGYLCGVQINEDGGTLYWPNGLVVKDADKTEIFLADSDGNETTEHYKEVK
jgi:hypothetical protein